MARTGRPKAILEVTAEERADLERYARGRTTAQALAFRARIVLLCASGKSNTQVARQVKADLGVVGKWRKRFIKDRVAGLTDLPRPNVHRKLDDERVEEVVRRTLESKPKASTHWSSRKMAKQAGVSQSSVSRIWRAFQLKPHRTRTFTLSTDPFFTEKVRDIVGLYMNPPDNAVVLCVDEKPAVQALERTQPVLPLVMGQSSRATATYKRHGVTNLFAALNVATCKVIGACFPDKRAIEYRRCGAGRPPGACRGGQFLNSQRATRPSLVEAASPIFSPFYADVFVLAESGRTLVCQLDGAGVATQQPHEHG